MTPILWLAAATPLAYLAAALAPERIVPVRGAVRIAAWASLAGAGLALAHALLFGPAGTPVLGVGGLGLAVRIDVLSAVFCALIAFVGLIVTAYSRNYLDGDPRQAAFLRGLCLALAFVQGFALAGNLGQLVLCWVGASLCVNRLLLFRGERQAAVLAARKRFLVSRVADACLIGATLLLWRAAGSADVGAILDAARAAPAGVGAAPAALLALAAIFSSAQLPVHGWILEVMETPTPVSALLHAGVVNAGGFLLLRFGEVMGAQPGALALLTVVGAASALFGSLVMLTQTSVKVGLAYSTIAQMGFMLLEVGLGAFSAALLHIVAHALYKAHAFLSAGEAAQGRAASRAKPAAGLAVAAVPAAVILGGVIASAFGLGPAQQPGAFVLTAVLLLGLARVWASGVEARAVVSTAVVTLLALVAYAAGQAVFGRLLGAGHGGAPGPLAAGTAVGVVALMTAMVCLQLRLPGRAGSPAWARAYALVSNGFYLNTLANRWVLRVWPASPAATRQHGAA